MKYLDEYRDPTAARKLLAEIRRRATRPWTLMEVCGGQTHSLLRHGIEAELEGTVELIHGPGCPVCVTPLEAIDFAQQLALRSDVILASFGDMLRVPGSRCSLLDTQAAGGHLRIVYSPLDAVELAKRHPHQHIVFFAVGFETTAPATALAVQQAARDGLDNFSLLVAHVCVQPAMEALVQSPDNRVQGFLAAGHVCTVMGFESYESFVEQYQLPVVVTGFEPLDLLEGILACVRQLESGEARVENQYARSVRREGNVAAQEIVWKVYEICDRPWRGFGVVRRCLRGLLSLSKSATNVNVMRDADNQPTWQLHCPVPIAADGERITLAHGEGGRLMRKLIRDRIIPLLGSNVLLSMDDAARLPQIDGPWAMTTDSFVVSPLLFPGGDIGSLAVYGTVNDLAVSGAQPLYMTLSLILEEGLPWELLECVLRSVAQAASKSNVQIVAGDTKVVPRGAADGLFINTTGVGQLIEPVPPGPSSLRAGDELIVTGPIGRHGIAVLCAREELALVPPPRSDCASLIGPARLLREQFGTRLRAMRDATRGGVGAVLHEWAEASSLTLTIDESAVPVSPDVRGACELLGLDPLHVANEGTMVVAVAPGSVQDILAALRSVPETAAATRIGTVAPRQVSPVTIRRTLGSEQPLDDPLGAALPRIC